MAAGHSAADLRLEFEGATEIAITDCGELAVTVEDSVLLQRPPIAYQIVDGARVPVTSRYVRHDDGSVGFAIGEHDPGRQLVIDPVLTYGTYFGGSGSDALVGISSDAAGNLYITGVCQL